MDTVKQFYKSEQWKKFRELMLLQRGMKCEVCGKVIVNSKSIHLHHIKELTPSNIQDAMITLNPENVQVVCHNCHNKIHDRYCKGATRKREKSVFIVYGSPLSGKKTFVKNNMNDNDIVVDMDKLFEAISFKELYDKPDKLKYNVFRLRDTLLDNIKTRYGNFNNAWIIGGYADKYKRETLAKELNAELIFIEATKEQCYERLNFCGDYRNKHKEKYRQYIDKWFTDFGAFTPSP